MKEYEVIIDFESVHLIIKADSKEEAEKKGFEEFGKKEYEEAFPRFWVGDCSEVEE